MRWLMIYQHPFANLINPLWDLGQPLDQISIASNKSDKWRINIQLPGMDKEDVSLRVENNHLIIEGEITKKVKGSKYFHKVNRSFFLSENLDVENIRAKMKNGLLEVEIPYSKSKTSGKLISVRGTDDSPYTEFESTNPIVSWFYKIKNKVKKVLGI